MDDVIDNGVDCLQNEMEAADGGRAGAVSRGGKLRGVPTALRRVLGRGAGVPGAARARGRRPVLPPGRRQRRRCRLRQHASKTAALPVKRNMQ